MRFLTTFHFAIVLSIVIYTSHAYQTGDAQYPKLNFINKVNAVSVRQPYYINAKNYLPYVFKRLDIPLGLRVTGQIRSDGVFSSRPYQTANVSELFSLWPVQNITTVTGGAGYAQQTVSVSNIFVLLGLYADLKAADDLLIRGFMNGEFSGIFSENGVYKIHFAYIEAIRKNARLLIGQYSNPMTIYENLPHVVSVNYGTPYIPYSVNPQISATAGFKRLRMQATIYSQYTFFDSGPSKTVANAYTGFSQLYGNNGISPIANLQLSNVTDDVEVGVSLNVKRIIPELVYHDAIGEPTDIQSRQSVTSCIFMGYGIYRASLLSMKGQIYYGTNATDLIMLGGYAVEKKLHDSNRRLFTKIPFVSSWFELERSVPKYGVQPGIFVGVTHQFGSSQELLLKQKLVKVQNGVETFYMYPEIYDLQHIESNELLQKTLSTLTTISPRVWIFIAPGAQIGLELVCSQAHYGYLDSYAHTTIEPEKVRAVRAIASMQYFF